MPSLSRGAVRKRRREAAAFAVSRRQSALTTTKGAGAAKPRRPRWGLRPAGRSAKRSGRTLVAPAAPAALFLALPSKSPASWCCAVRVREAAKTPVGSWTGWAVCKAERAHPCCARAAPQALVACGAALRVLCAKILRQNRRFLMPLRLGRRRKKRPRAAWVRGRGGLWGRALICALPGIPDTPGSRCSSSAPKSGGSSWSPGRGDRGCRCPRSP